MRQITILLRVSNQFEIAPLRRQKDLLLPVNEAFRPYSVRNQILNRDYPQTITLCELHQIRHSRHRSVLIHNLHQSPRRIKPRQASQINRCLRMPRPFQHTILLSIQRIDVSRPSESTRSRRPISQSPDRSSPIRSRNPRRTTLQLIDRNRKRRTENRSIIDNLMLQLQFPATRHRYRSAKHPPCMLQHEVNLLRSYHFRSNNQVSLILPILIIDHDNEITLFEILDSLLYCA